MARFAFRLPLALLLTGLSPASLHGQASSVALSLIGAGGTAKTLSFADLQALPQIDVVVVNKDSSRTTFRGPTLRSLMTLVGAPAGHELRGPSMLLAVVAEAADSYRVAYMLAEIDEQFGVRQAIVAVTQDRAPLSATDGPLRIILAGEDHRARWIRQVVRLRLVPVI
jgi:hypothetical protein